MKHANTNCELALDSNQAYMNRERENKYFSVRIINKKSISFYLMIIGILLLLSTESVYGQFVVQPGKIEESLKSRQEVTRLITIHNYETEKNITVDIKLLELTQSPDGEWLPVDTDPCNNHDYDPTMDISEFYSCSSWITLEKEQVDIVPNGDAEVAVTINTPPRVSRGFYFAAIVVSTEIMSENMGDRNIPMIIRVVVPIIANVNLETRPLPNHIVLEGIGLEYEPGLNGFGGKTVATVKVRNEGRTFPRLIPIVRIRGLFDGKWRLITSHTLGEIGIIPGVELNLKGDIGRSLPSSKYQLEGALYVDGKISERIDSFEINYVGDPMVTQAFTEVPLDLLPDCLELSTKPGARSNGYFEIYNAGPERVKVISSLGFPQILAGKTIGQVKVSDMSCTDWLFLPEEKAIDLSGNGNRNLRIRTEMPPNALQFPYYYAEVNLEAIYSDGESAGVKKAIVCVKNENVVNVEPDVKFLILDIREQDRANSVYVVLVGFVNEGKVHIVPKKCIALVAAADGYGRTFATLKANKGGILLPSERRTFSGNIDFSTVEPGDYHLEVMLEHLSGNKTTKQITLRVTEENNVKVPHIMQQNLKSSEIIPIKW